MNETEEDSVKDEKKPKDKYIILFSCLGNTK